METSLARKAREAIVPGAAVSARKKHIALGVAAIADIVQVVFWPAMSEGALSPFEDALDVAVAIILMSVLGFQWRLLFTFGVELVPGLDLFPSWTAVVLSLPTLPEEVSTPALAKVVPPRFLSSCPQAFRLMELPCTVPYERFSAPFPSSPSFSRRAPLRRIWSMSASGSSLDSAVIS